MSRTAVAALILLTGIAGLAASGCSAPKPFVREGDANSVEIGYSGNIETAMPVARRHCAQFERVPRSAGRTLDGALFDCVPPGSAS